MKPFFFALVVAALTTATLSVLPRSGNVRCRVIDAGTREPLAGVQVILDNGDTWFEAETDSTGDVLARHLPAGEYRLQLREAGYRKLEIEDVDVVASRTTELELELQYTVQGCY